MRCMLSLLNNVLVQQHAMTLYKRYMQQHINNIFEMMNVYITLVLTQHLQCCKQHTPCTSLMYTYLYARRFYVHIHLCYKIKIMTSSFPCRIREPWRGSPTTTKLPQQQVNRLFGSQLKNRYPHKGYKVFRIHI